MAWIELHQSIRDHRKTVTLADMLDIPEAHAVGHLTFLWMWALDNAPDAALPMSARIIARASGWEGDPGAWVDALITSGFLEHDHMIHDWYDYAGRLIDKRKANTERMREARARNVQRTNDAHAGATLPYPTVPNPTEPDPTKPTGEGAQKRATLPRKERETSMPDDWEVTSSLVMYGSEQGMTPEQTRDHLESFRLYCQSNDKRYVNWTAAAQRWLREQKNFTRSHTYANGNGPIRRATDLDIDQWVDELKERKGIT